MKKEELDFEQSLFLHRPEVFEKYMEDKKEKEDSLFDEIIWKTPESMEEAEMITAAIQKSNEKIIDSIEETSDKESFDDSVEIAFLKQFEGIDLSKLGNEE